MAGVMVHKYSLMASVAAVVFAAPAFAADLPTKAMPMVAPPVSTWTGFYIGVNGGYGWGKDNFDDPVALSFALLDGRTAPATINGLSPKGGVFGGHAGYNWQSGSWVGGLEADLDGADIKATNSLSFSSIDGTTFSQSNSTKFDTLATLRARLGLLIVPDVLIYGTAGGAAAHTENSAFANPGFSDPVTFTSGQNQFGWSGGGGIEGKLTALGLSNVTLRVEYLHYGFLNASTPFASTVDLTNGFTLSHKSSIDVVRGGLTWQFTSVPGRY